MLSVWIWREHLLEVSCIENRATTVQFHNRCLRVHDGQGIWPCPIKYPVIEGMLVSLLEGLVLRCSATTTVLVKYTYCRPTATWCAC